MNQLSRVMDPDDIISLLEKLLEGVDILSERNTIIKQYVKEKKEKEFIKIQKEVRKIVKKRGGKSNTGKGDHHNLELDDIDTHDIGVQTEPLDLGAIKAKASQPKRKTTVNKKDKELVNLLAETPTATHKKG